MSQYIEELSHGDCFQYDNKKYILSCDYKKDFSRLVINLFNGTPKWFKSDDIIVKIQIFTMDKDNCIIAIKETMKNDISAIENIS
jgi:hypothetical protein